MRSAEELAAYRVDRGNGGFRAIPMAEEEIIERNFFIRLILRNNPAWELTNEQLEQVRIYRIGEVLVIEDDELRVFVLKEAKEIVR